MRTISSAHSDAELVNFYKLDGDMQALGDLYDRYMEMVYGVCLKYFKEPEVSKDAVIHIFEELTIKVRKYEISNFKSWLYQLTKNHCLMKLRSDKTKPAIVDSEIVYLAEKDHQDNGWLKEEQLTSMENCIEKLPAEQKEVIRLFYLEEKCYKEIAELRGEDVGKIRSYIQNGRRNLKICMEKQKLQNA